MLKQLDFFFSDRVTCLIKLLQDLSRKLGEFKDAIQGITATVASLTIGVDEIFKVTAFECLCVSKSDLAIPCTAALNSFPRRDKELYAYLFIFIPSFILLMAGLSFNQIVWKEITSCCRHYKPKSKEEYKVNCTSFCKIVAFASFAPD